MSPAAREADSRWIGELWQNYLTTVASNRQITLHRSSPVLRACWTACARLTAIPRNMRLITSWSMPREPARRIEKSLSKQFGWSKEDKNYSAISMYDYAAKNRMRAVTALRSSSPMAQSWTVRRLRERRGDTTESQIRDARLDPKVKAIVLRVNSPGAASAPLK